MSGRVQSLARNSSNTNSGDLGRAFAALACESEYSSSATVTDFQSSAESSRKRLSLALGAYQNFQPFSSKLQMPANAGPDDQ